MHLVIAGNVRSISSYLVEVFIPVNGLDNIVTYSVVRSLISQDSKKKQKKNKM